MGCGGNSCSNKTSFREDWGICQKISIICVKKVSVYNVYNNVYACIYVVVTETSVCFEICIYKKTCLLRVWSGCRSWHFCWRQFLMRDIVQKRNVTLVRLCLPTTSVRQFSRLAQHLSCPTSQPAHHLSWLTVSDWPHISVHVCVWVVSVNAILHMSTGCAFVRHI